MSKYLEWKLVKRELLPIDSYTVVGDNNGAIKRHIKNTYACPYCDKQIYGIRNKLEIRKCRFCGHYVSSYKGDTRDEIWLPEGVEELPN